MKRKMSFRLRLTLVTTIMLAVVCMVFTIFSMINLNYTLVVPVQNLISGESTTAESLTTEENGTIMDVEISDSGEDIVLNASAVVDELSFRMRIFVLVSVLFMFVAILSGIFIMYHVSGSVVRPVNRLKDEIQGIQRKDLSYRIQDFEAGEELNQLADSFNTLLEKLDQTFARETRFISDATHEMKTPLAVIRTNLEVLGLEEHPSEERYRNSFEVIKRQSQRLSDLMDHLLNMATVNDYEMSHHIRLDSLVQEILEELEPLMNKAGISHEVHLEPLEVRGNPVLLKHGIHNIIENAIKYNCQDGKIIIQLKAESGTCVLEVKDTGMGIPEEFRSHIFEPFYRVDKSRSRAIGGSGLGLAIAHEIIQKHGGEILCGENQPVGSVFSIRLLVDQE